MRKVLLVIFVLLSGFSLVAQKPDSVSMSLEQAEALFFKNNLSLLSARYSVDASQALVEQARYWDNPVLNTDQNIYDGAFFRHNADFGQVYVQLQQLIRTAGKRNKLIRLAQDDVLTASQQLNELLRNLRFVLRNDFELLHLQISTWQLYTKELASLQKLSEGMDAQLKAGNVSQKDNIRVKALLYSLQADAADLEREMADSQKELAVLLNISGDTVLVPNRPDRLSIPVLPPVAALRDSAKNNRPDLLLAKTAFRTRTDELSYQKALAKPDLTVGMEYDQRSSYVNNFWGLNLSLPLPVFNRNKGNIRAAGIRSASAQVELDLAAHHVMQEVNAAYHKLAGMEQLQQLIAPDFMEKYNQLLGNMVSSYQQRQVSLVEFIDFFDAFKEAAGKQLQQQQLLVNAVEELNYATGTTIIKLN